MTATCEIDGCDGEDHLRGLCREHYVRQLHAEAPNKHPKAWTPDEDRYFEAILDSRADGLGHAEIGELDEIADKIGRTKHATRQRLTTLRRRRKERQTAEILSRATR